MIVPGALRRTRMPPVKMQKLGGTDAFIVFDLEGAAYNVGITRLAPKILVDGATLLARSTTYLFASFEQQAGGASAGINTKPEGRDAAIAAFVDEVIPMAKSGTFLTEPGRGLSAEDLAPLTAADPRVGLSFDESHSLLGHGVALSAARALGDLSGRTAAVEGLDRLNVSVLTELAERGASVVAASTTSGTISDPAGLDVAALSAAITEQGPAAVEGFGPEVAPAGAVLAAEVDLLCLGSKPGILDHEGAADVRARCLVPIGPVPITAKGLAVLRRAGAIVLPDFITTSGPMFGAFPDEGATIADVRRRVEDEIGGALDDVLDHEDGPLLGACYRAEAYLETWQETLPFGRPLA
jgi:glutamate dehydrogenase (NAD(P)+)